MIEYPLGLHIETTGRCNSCCSFCPHERSTRKNSNMSSELFEKILTEAKGIPHPFCLSPFKLGEPMLDPLFSKRLLRIHEELPRATLEIHTNLNYLPADFIPALKVVKNLSHVWVSLNQRTPENYLAETGLRLDKTLANIETLLAANVPHKIVIGRVANYDAEDRSWFEWAKKKFTAATCVVMYRGNWCDNIDAKPMAPKAKTTGPCPRTYELSICCDGKVALCCMDGLCEYPLGDMNTQTMLEIYNSPKAKLMRTAQARFMKPCNTCTFV